MTYDKRFYACLLGQDLLEQLYYIHLKNVKELFILDNEIDMKQYMDSV